MKLFVSKVSLKDSILQGSLRVGSAFRKKLPPKFTLQDLHQEMNSYAFWFRPFYISGANHIRCQVDISRVCLHSIYTVHCSHRQNASIGVYIRMELPFGAVKLSINVLSDEDIFIYFKNKQGHRIPNLLSLSR